MQLKRRGANFIIKDCGLRNLQNSKLQKLIRALMDEIDLQHLRDSHPCPSFQDRSAMFSFIHETKIQSAPIDYLEFGVFQGDSIREWIRLNHNPESRFFGFDSFEGLPEDWRPGQSAGHFRVDGVPDIDDSRVQFLKGWFDHTIPAFAPKFSSRNRLLLHLDADLYGSTMLPLVHFAPYMAPGTLMIFDEFYDRDHEFKALRDWHRIFRKPFRIIAQMHDYGRVCAELV